MKSYIYIYIYIFFFWHETHTMVREHTTRRTGEQFVAIVFPLLKKKLAIVLPLLWSKSEALSIAYLLAVQRPFLLGTYGVT